MRRTTIAAGIAAAAIAGTALAVPALAEPTTPAATATATALASSSSARTDSLTPAQRQELDDFLAAHPRVAEALVARIDRWKQLAAAHPELVAELKKVAELPADQRHEELATWFRGHPDDAKAWHAFRQEVRDDRQDRREQRRERRQERRDAPQGPRT
jgi:hypothetical protein